MQLMPNSAQESGVAVLENLASWENKLTLVENQSYCFGGGESCAESDFPCLDRAIG